MHCSKNSPSFRKLLWILIAGLTGLGSPRSAHAETDEIRLGVVLSLTGYGAVGGAAERNALEMAADEVNAKGGIGGKKLLLVIEDNHSEQKATAAAIHRLASVEKVPLIFGPNWTEFGQAAAPIAEQQGVVMLATSAYDPELTRNREFVFTVCQSHAESVRPLADEIVKRRLKRVVLLRSSNAFLEALSNGVRSQFAAHGQGFWKEFQFNPGEADFRSTIAQLKRSNVDGVVVFLLEGGDLQSFLRQAKELNFSANFFSGTNIPTDPVILANKSLAEGIIFYDFKMPRESEFWSKYRKRYGVEPWFTSPKAYDNVFLVQQAIERCGASAREIARCLSESDYGGVSGRVRFDASHNIVIDESITQLFQVRKGEFVPLASDFH